MPRAADRAAVTAHAHRAGNDVVHSRAFEIASRAGFVARGLVYAIIGVLALQVAFGDGGKLVDQQGAMESLDRTTAGHVTLILLVAGLAGYGIWRLFRAALGHGPEGADKGIERIGALGSGLVYAFLAYVALKILTGPSGGSGKPSRTTAAVLDWPAGRWLVGIAGIVAVGIGIYQVVRGITRSFLDDDKTGEMSRPVKSLMTTLGMSGHVARGVVFGLVGVFLVKAAVEFDPEEAVGIDGALARLADRTYGQVLLGVVAAGLLLFGIFSIVEARYRRI
jgi:hypothetical protein